ncbi:MAG: hypothetical protein EOO60_09540, partial [Hymenobacter sp.]
MQHLPFPSMKFARIFLGGILLGSSATAQAQSAEPVSAPHFYGGLGVYSSSHHNLSSWGNGARIPVQALLGYQWRPRLAVQLGVAYSGNHSDYTYSTSYSSYYPTPPSTLTDVAGTYTERSTTISLLARYTLTRKLAHRFQADALGGIKVEYSRYRDAGTYTTHAQATPAVTPFEYPATYNSTLLSLGISLRYRMVSQLEAVYD